MTKRLFDALEVCQDKVARSAAMNMAIDEALFESVLVPAIRFYRWQSPALSFGYFGRFADVVRYQHQRDLVRRWTGGGMVFHGEDLTYSIVIPATDAAFTESSIAIYEKIHRALVDGLSETGQRAVVAGVGDPGQSSTIMATPAGIPDAGYSCFEHPVRADVTIDGRKVAGAAQRRTSRGLLQQGSIQGIDVEDDLAQRFAEALSAARSDRELEGEVLNRARDLAERKFGTDFWMRKR